MKKNTKQIKNHMIFNKILMTILIIYTIALLSVILWGMYTSVKSFDEYRNNIAFPPRQNILNWEWENFTVILNNFTVRPRGSVRSIGVLEQLWNTILFAGVGSLITTVVTCVMAYVVAIYDNKFSKLIYSVVLVTMILPIVGSYPSEIALLRNLGLYDTFIGIWIQRANFLGIYFLVFYAQFKTLPKDYAEAAYMDGASEFKIMTKIMMPLVANTFGTILLIKFIEGWNDYQTVLLYLPTKPTLIYGLFELSNNTVGELNTVPMRMAGVMMLIIPVIAVFIAFRNRLLDNITAGGIKE